MQCIEGDRAAANACLHRIGLDDRHSGIAIISHDEIVRPQFPQWHMIAPSLPMQPHLAEPGLMQLLAGETVTDATRTIFQSFGSLGTKIGRG